MQTLPEIISKIPFCRFCFLSPLFLLTFTESKCFFVARFSHSPILESLRPCSYLFIALVSGLPVHFGAARHINPAVVSVSRSQNESKKSLFKRTKGTSLAKSNSQTNACLFKWRDRSTSAWPAHPGVVACVLTSAFFLSPHAGCFCSAPPPFLPIYLKTCRHCARFDNQHILAHVFIDVGLLLTVSIYQLWV